jgi:hypothetical protein
VKLRFIDIESPSSNSRVGGGGHRGGTERKYKTQCERLQESIHVVSSGQIFLWGESGIAAGGLQYASIRIYALLASEKNR